MTASPSRNLRHHRPVPLSLPSFRVQPPHLPFSPSSLPTPSKNNRRHHSSTNSSSSYSSLLLLLLSLRSVYSLLPFLRSSPPSFSLFPFSFLVSLLSLLLLLPFSSPSLLLSSAPDIFASIRPLALNSLLLTLSFLLRFHSLRFCSASASILSDLSGSLLAYSSTSKLIRKKRHLLPGLLSLLLSLSLLSRSWDRLGCSPFSSERSSDCARLVPMLLPFLSGFLSFHHHNSPSPLPLRQLGRTNLRVLSLSLTALSLFFPALFTLFLQGSAFASALPSPSSLGWPLANTVVFGVVLAADSNPKDFGKEFTVTFFCTLLLELVYDPKLSLPGFLFCGLLLWFSVRELGSSSVNYPELGSSDPGESLYSMVVKPVRHILSERKSRKIALFLLINAAYMVVEFVVGFMSNSLGLISDACHMLFDCAALAIGLYASYISRLPANHRYNYGRGRFEVLSGYVNAVLLVLVGVLIVLESIERILDPQEISTNSLLGVSVGGFLVNMVGLVFFHEEHHHAHGGGGTCSHSHSATHRPHQHEHTGLENEQCGEHKHAHGDGGTCSHSHLDLHHHHDHHKHGTNGHEHSAEHDKGDEVSHQSCTHGKHHHNDHHDHHRHGHEHGHHCNGQEHDHHHHGHEHGHHCNGLEHDHHHHEHHDNQKLDISLRGSHNHSHEDHAYSCCRNAEDRCSHHVEPSHSPHSVKKEPQKHRHVDHNMEGIFLHVLADTLGSVGVVISTLLIKYKGWLVADPASSIFISVMIISSVVPLLRNSAEILLQRTPRAHEQDLRIALSDLRKVRGVCGIRKLHIWNLTNTDIVGTLHLHVSPDTDKASIRDRASELLHNAGINDLTIQVECMAG